MDNMMNNVMNNIEKLYNSINFHDASVIDLITLIYRDMANIFRTNKHDEHSRLLQIIFDVIPLVSDRVLLSNTEVKANHDNRLYYVLKTDTKIKLLTFHIFITAYQYIAKHHQCIIGIDYEFNTKKIALMQINFEIPKKYSNTSFIYIVYPPQFDVKLHNYFIEHIMTNNHILKIVHGADSLDIPYMYAELFRNNKSDIIAFTDTVVDTKYLCEYHNITYKLDRKCRIYSLLTDWNIIDGKQLAYLETNEDQMGHIYEIFIDIAKISNNLLTYSLYDVIYLEYLYQAAVRNIGIDGVGLICDATRIIYLERRDIVTTIHDITIPVNSMNNYMIMSLNKIKLIDKYTDVIIKIESVVPNVKNLLLINYFRSTFIVLFKYIIYSALYTKYTIYKNSSEKFVDDLNIDRVVDTYRHRKYFYVLLREFIHNVKQII
jgi:hypothetical protein